MRRTPRPKARRNHTRWAFAVLAILATHALLLRYSPQPRA